MKTNTKTETAKCGVALGIDIGKVVDVMVIVVVLMINVIVIEIVIVTSRAPGPKKGGDEDRCYQAWYGMVWLSHPGRRRTRWVDGIKKVTLYPSSIIVSLVGRHQTRRGCWPCEKSMNRAF